MEINRWSLIAPCRAELRFHLNCPYSLVTPLVFWCFLYLPSGVFTCFRSNSQWNGLRNFLSKWLVFARELQFTMRVTSQNLTPRISASSLWLAVLVTMSIKGSCLLGNKTTSSLRYLAAERSRSYQRVARSISSNDASIWLQSSIAAAPARGLEHEQRRKFHDTIHAYNPSTDRVLPIRHIAFVPSLLTNATCLVFAKCFLADHWADEQARPPTTTCWRHLLGSVLIISTSIVPPCQSTVTTP